MKKTLTKKETERAIFLRREKGCTYQELAQIFNMNFQDMYLFLSPKKVPKGDRATVHRTKLRSDIVNLLNKGELNQNQIAKVLKTSRQYVSLIKKERANDCKT